MAPHDRMSLASPAARAGDSAARPRMHVGEVLRMARQRRSWPQLELALTLDVSQRHVSFVEWGRARPSRTLVEDWMTATHAPATWRDAALSLAGFAPEPEVPLDWTGDEPALAPLRRLLALEMPMPLLVFDDDWRILASNAAAEWIAPIVMPRYCEERGIRCTGMDMIDSVVAKDGLLHGAVNAAAVAGALLEQLTLESWVNPALAERVERLRVATFQRHPRARAPEPSVPASRIAFDTAAGELTFDFVQQVCPLSPGRRLRTEQWVPADERTERFLATRAA